VNGVHHKTTRSSTSTIQHIPCTFKWHNKNPHKIWAQQMDGFI
jgi:hypothetical protein